jgi:hypothetical protein
LRCASAPAGSPPRATDHRNGAAGNSASNEAPRDRVRPMGVLACACFLHADYLLGSPKVKGNTRTPGSRNSMLKVRSWMAPDWMSW